MSVRFVQLSLLALLISCCGCDFNSSNIADVEGVVTIDGTPVDRARVMFHPTSGRGSFGETDAKGHYTLVHSKKSDGALIGKHKVTIATERTGDYLDGPGDQERKEMMPSKYLDKETTDLTADVKSGSNKIDFSLKSSEF